MPAALSARSQVAEHDQGDKERDMSSNAVQVFVAAYQSEDAAGAALKDFRAMHREGSIELIDAAVAVVSS